MLSLLLAFTPATADPGAETSRVVAMPTSTASERLDQLLAAHGLSPSGQSALTALAPSLDAVARTPEVAAAIALILAMPPSEIGRVRKGESVIRQSGEWKEKEADAVEALADALHTAAAVDTVSIRTDDAELVRVELLSGKKSRSARLAWPQAWTTPGPGLVDASFENPRTLGIAWRIATSVKQGAPAVAGLGDARLDAARPRAGATSLRIDAPRKAKTSVSQTIQVDEGELVRILLQVAPDAAEAEVIANFIGHKGVIAGQMQFVEKTTGWRDVLLEREAPPGTTTMALILSVSGPGAANFDDIRISVEGVGGGTAVTAQGPLRVRHDGTLSVDISNAAAITTRALTLLGLPPGKPVTVDHAACQELSRCSVDKWVRRAWGPPVNDAIGADVISAAIGNPSPYADVLKNDGAVALRQRWSGEP